MLKCAISWARDETCCVAVPKQDAPIKLVEQCALQSVVEPTDKRSFRLVKLYRPWAPVNELAFVPWWHMQVAPPKKCIRSNILLKSSLRSLNVRDRAAEAERADRVA